LAGAIEEYLQLFEKEER
jgi:hypothetical protein